MYVWLRWHVWGMAAVLRWHVSHTVEGQGEEEMKSLEVGGPLAL